MTYFHYYATTSRNLDRVMQYGVFPLTKAAWLVALSGIGDYSKRIRWASDLARVSSAVTYSGLTTAFLGAESEMIDSSAKQAVSAEMGVASEKLRFSDYNRTDNAIVKTAYHDMLRLQKFRYGSDALFMLPILLRKGAHWANIPWIEHSREVNQMIARGENIGFGSMMLSGNPAWDFSVLAGKAAYWAGETYFVDKSGHYEVVKLMENLRSTGKDASVNDLLGVFQRTRINDLKLPAIERKEEYDALKPLLQRMVDAYNQHDNKFELSEVVYLIGLNKIRIHGPDNRTISKEAIEQSNKEIDKVLAIGLDGIREENKKRNAEHGVNPLLHKRSFRELVSDGAVEAAQSFSGTLSRIIMGDGPRRPEEYITPRNPGELAHWDRGINR
ncbi:MAG: hypothetical protein AB7L92_07200 [Alphaproteobacteria bacterium]